MNKKTNAQLMEKLQGIAGHLPGTWAAESVYAHLGALVRDDGLTLHVRTEGSVWSDADLSGAKLNAYLKQISHNGHYYFSGYSNPAPSIGFSFNRSAKALARDIERRLLPDAEREHPKQVEYFESVKARENRQQQILDMIER